MTYKFTPPAPVPITCPHCVGEHGFCCACRGAKTLAPERAMLFTQNVWDVPGCDCAVCQALRRKRPAERRLP